MPKWWNDTHQERLKVFAREDADWGLIRCIGGVEGATTATERSWIHTRACFALAFLDLVTTQNFVRTLLKLGYEDRFDLSTNQSLHLLVLPYLRLPAVWHRTRTFSKTRRRARIRLSTSSQLLCKL